MGYLNIDSVIYEELNNKEEGLTLLHHAIKNNSKKIIKFLIQKGCDINKANEIMPIIHYAVGENKSESVRVLLKTGKVDVNLKSINDITALNLALSNSKEYNEKKLEKKSKDCNKIIGELIKYGANPNIMNDCLGITPFLYAVMSNNLDFKILFNFQ